MRRLILVLALCLAPIVAVAVQPDEMLPDPGQEARARAITKELRCVVCQSESLDESNATIAKDLRLMVRERIVAGDSDEQVMKYVVDRYGEFVLLRPSFSLANAALWLSGPVFLIIGGGLAFAFIRRRTRTNLPGTPALSREEDARLRELLED